MEEKQIPELLSTLLERVTSAAEVVVFHLELEQGGQNVRGKEGFGYLCLCVLTTRISLLTSLQQLSKALLPIPARFHSLLRFSPDTIPYFNSQSQSFNAKTPPAHPAAEPWSVTPRWRSDSLEQQ